MFYQFFTQNPANFSNKSTKQNKNHHLNATSSPKDQGEKMLGQVRERREEEFNSELDDSMHV